MTNTSLTLALAVLGGPFDAPVPPTDTSCWTAPLQLSFAESLKTAEVAQKVAATHCARAPALTGVPTSLASFTVARTRIGKLRLAGQDLPVGFNVVVRPVGPGRPDSIYMVPAVDLPPEWTEAIDLATYPALAVGGAVVLTSVLLQLVQ